MTAGNILAFAQVAGLDLTEDEDVAGVTDAYAITFRRVTVVVFESAGGVTVVGIHTTWPGGRATPETSLRKARARAFTNLAKAQAAAADFASRQRRGSKG